ncbi:pyrimidine dimer DNA glycosylase/endonuclease V [Salinicoccus sp. HZC-1]|uniref:pyrimidine dimer DNA glycosylase/endonuclease V n=1 Tax=Salinicoccus sp. HZC-1 TaxID=3385497 RepID=UPI00398B93D5
MQIFRISPDHEESARFLDNRRLSKQVLELYQIIRVNLSLIGVLDTNTRYRHHPIVRHVYNDGHPYITDTAALLFACDREHQRRGGKRSAEFRNDLDILKKLVETHRTDDIWSDEALPPLYVFGDARIYGDEAYAYYQRLLYEKWQADKIAPRCGVKLRVI